MLNILNQIATEAGRIIKCMQNSAARIAKGTEGDMLTAADLASQEYILAELEKHFPGIPVVAEESDWPESLPEECFVVDPIDGTFPYAAGFDHYCVTLSYLKNGQPECGVAVQPARNTLLSVKQGESVLINGNSITLPDKPATERTTSGEMVPRKLVVLSDIYHGITPQMLERYVHSLLPEIQVMMLFSSAIAAGIYLLEGKADCYFAMNGTKVWDFGPTALAIQQLGGTASNLNGSPLKWDKLPMTPLLTRSPEVRDKIFSRWGIA